MGGSIGKRQGLAGVAKENASCGLPLPQPPGLFSRGIPLKDRTSLSEFNLTDIASNITHRFSVLSGLSFISFVSVPQVENQRRPWSRISRKRWHPKTLQNEYAQCKAVWPVVQTEALFLPQFPIGIEEKLQLVFLGEINRGAFGQVFHVRCASTRREYAMKVLSKSQVCSLDAVAQVKQEVMIQHICSHHPFITPLVHFWQTRKLIIVMTEYVGYGELQQLWRSLGSFPEKLLTIYVAEIALAIDFLHNAGIIYRDLKMENILLDVDGHIKLIDFGLSKWLTYGGRTRTICGTLQFMAPEILLGEEYGHAVDWWSLGIIAYSLLVGNYPVSGYDDHVSMCAAVEKFSYPMPAAASKPLKSVLIGLLERNPANRINALHKIEKEELYMGTDLDEVRDKKIAPRSILERFIEDKSRHNFEDFAGLTSTPKKSLSSTGVSMGDFSRVQSSNFPRRTIWDRSRRSSSSPLLCSPLMHPGRLGHHDSLVKSINGYNGAAVPLLQSPLLRLAQGRQARTCNRRQQTEVSASALPTAVSPLLINVKGNRHNKWIIKSDSSEAINTVSGMNGVYKKCNISDECVVREEKVKALDIIKRSKMDGAGHHPPFTSTVSKLAREKIVETEPPPDDVENFDFMKEDFFSGLVTSTPKHKICREATETKLVDHESGATETKQVGLESGATDTKQVGLESVATETNQVGLESGATETKQVGLEFGATETKQWGLQPGATYTKQEGLQPVNNKCNLINGALLGNNFSPLNENDFDDTLEHFPWISESFET